MVDKILTRIHESNFAIPFLSGFVCGGAVVILSL